jgi:hypothetical protein
MGAKRTDKTDGNGVAAKSKQLQSNQPFSSKSLFDFPSPVLICIHLREDVITVLMGSSMVGHDLPRIGTQSEVIFKLQRL